MDLGLGFGFSPPVAAAVSSDPTTKTNTKTKTVEIDRDLDTTPTPLSPGHSTSFRKASIADLISSSLQTPHDPHIQPTIHDIEHKPTLLSSISAPPGSIMTTSDLALDFDSAIPGEGVHGSGSCSNSSSDEEGPVKGFSFGTCPTSAPLEPTSASDLFLGTPTAEKGPFEYPLFSPGSPTAKTCSSSVTFPPSSRRGSVAFGLPPVDPRASFASTSSSSSSGGYSRRSSVIQASHHSYFHPSNIATPSLLPNSRKPSLTRRSSSSASTITSYSPDLDTIASSSTPGPSTYSRTPAAGSSRRPSLHPITATPILPLPQPQIQSGRRGSIMFQPRTGPTPIPPSLLARRGSLPATAQIFGLPVGEKRLGAGMRMSGSGGAGVGVGLSGIARAAGGSNSSGSGLEAENASGLKRNGSLGSRNRGIPGSAGSFSVDAGGSASSSVDPNHERPLYSPQPLHSTPSSPITASRYPSQRRSSIANGHIHLLAQARAQLFAQTTPPGSMDPIPHPSAATMTGATYHGSGSGEEPSYRRAPRKSSLLSSESTTYGEGEDSAPDEVGFSFGSRLSSAALKTQAETDKLHPISSPMRQRSSAPPDLHLAQSAFSHDLDYGRRSSAEQHTFLRKGSKSSQYRTSLSGLSSSEEEEEGEGQVEGQGDGQGEGQKDGQGQRLDGYEAADKVNLQYARNTGPGQENMVGTAGQTGGQAPLFADPWARS